MLKLLKNWAWGFIAIVGCIINVMAYIPPQDAISNVSKWIKAEGFDPPLWLQEGNVDEIVHWVSKLVIAIAALVFLLPLIQYLRSKYFGDKLPRIKSPFSGKPTECIKNMWGNGTFADGICELREGNSIRTSRDFSPPIAFRLTAKTNSENLRISYDETKIIFNWENNHDELRIDGGPVDKQHKNGVGEIPVYRWVRIDLIIKPNSILIFVEGSRRYYKDADFSAVVGSFSIYQKGLSIVHVRSLLAGQPI